MLKVFMILFIPLRTSNMNIIRKIMQAAAVALLLVAPTTTWAQYTPTAENLKSRQEFADSKFGIFIHWGIYH